MLYLLSDRSGLDLMPFYDYLSSLDKIMLLESLLCDECNRLFLLKRKYSSENEVIPPSDQLRKFLKFGWSFVCKMKTYAAFIHNGFDDQERNLIFVKMDIQVLKLKFHAYNL